jgi:hypothetical protein
MNFALSYAMPMLLLALGRAAGGSATLRMSMNNVHIPRGF